MANHRTNKTKLTRAEKQQLKSLMVRNRQKGKKGSYSAQDTIPYQRMWPDGICRVSDQYYTKTIQFQDINYQLAQNDDKTAIFEGWCDFLNYFDSSIHLQFSFLDLTASTETFEQSILIPDRDDGNNEIRSEYAEMLQNQQAKGNNGLTKTKFITFGIEAENIRIATSICSTRQRVIVRFWRRNWAFLRISCPTSPRAAKARACCSMAMSSCRSRIGFRRIPGCTAS